MKKKDFAYHVVILNTVNVFVISQCGVQREWNSTFKY